MTAVLPGRSNGFAPLGKIVAVAEPWDVQRREMAETHGVPPLERLTFQGASVLDITSSGGASRGLYTLVSAAAAIIGVAPATVTIPWSMRMALVFN